MNFKRFTEKRKAWLRSRSVPQKCIILLYHRISSHKKDLDPYSLTVSPENFSKHLQIIKSNYNVISLSTLVQRLINKDNVNNTIIITFDDGYANNLFFAKPLLEEFKVPAAFFITSDFFGEYFWWDIITLNISDVLKEKKIVLGNNEFFFKGSPNGKFKVQEEIYSFIRSMDYQKKKDLLREIKALNCNSTRDDMLRCMTKDEIISFSKSPFIEIGGHTVSHFPLSTIDAESQRVEILKNKAEMENLIQKKIDLFSYPHGDFNDSTKDILSENLFRCALTVNQGVNHISSDLLQLNRIPVKNWGNKKFQFVLKHWF